MEAGFWEVQRNLRANERIKISFLAKFLKESNLQF
jgi:hypothetical protein